MALLFNPTSASASPAPKIYTTLGPLPPFIDPAQPPRRRQPFRALDGVGFVKGVEVLVPEEVFRALSGEGGGEGEGRGRYASVQMALGGWLDGEIFEKGVKIGSILALSGGRPGVDNLFYIKEGVLHLDLDKEAYERAGLQGKPTPSGGRKHVKSRYVVEVDLKQASIRHGRKGFERVRWAAKNVLNSPLRWLVYDGQCAEDDQKAHGLSLLAKYNPVMIPLETHISSSAAVRVPPLKPPDLSNNLHAIDISEWTQETVEWVGLVGLGSPRVRPNDTIDPYLCRWAFPDDTPEEPQEIRVLRWNGLMDGAWVRKLLVEYIKITKSLSPIAPQNLWLALTVQAHPTASTTNSDGYTIVLTGAWPPAPAPTTAGPQIQAPALPEVENTQQPHWATEDKSTTEKGKKRRRTSEANAEESAKQSAHVDRATGLREFALFEFVDTIVPY